VYLEWPTIDLSLFYVVDCDELIAMCVLILVLLDELFIL
jgi:hypothetical protein